MWWQLFILGKDIPQNWSWSRAGQIRDCKTFDLLWKYSCKASVKHQMLPKHRGEWRQWSFNCQRLVWVTVSVWARYSARWWPRDTVVSVDICPLGRYSLVSDINKEINNYYPASVKKQKEQRGKSGQEPFLWFLCKERMSRHVGLRLACLNNFRGLWGRAFPAGEQQVQWHRGKSILT